MRKDAACVLPQAPEAPGLWSVGFWEIPLTGSWLKGQWWGLGSPQIISCESSTYHGHNSSRVRRVRLTWTDVMDWPSTNIIHDTPLLWGRRMTSSKTREPESSSVYFPRVARESRDAKNTGFSLYIFELSCEKQLHLARYSRYFNDGMSHMEMSRRVGGTPKSPWRQKAQSRTLRRSPNRNDPINGETWVFSSERLA